MPHSGCSVLHGVNNNFKKNNIKKLLLYTHDQYQGFFIIFLPVFEKCLILSIFVEMFYFNLEHQRNFN